MSEDVLDDEVMDGELLSLLQQASEGLLDIPFPDPRPADGQSREAWASRVSRLRHQHDAQALERTRVIGFDPPITEGIDRIEYHDVPVDGDEVAVRMYHPTPSDSPAPAVLVFHGGAWWMGGGATGFELNDLLCRLLCKELGAVVANVDYRLAPEYPYPTQLEDGYATLQWMHDNADRFGVDRQRVGVFGISSGGNLAAALCLVSRDRGGPAIAAQILLAPSLDFTASMRLDAADEQMRAAIRRLRCYYANEVDDWATPYLSPAIAGDLSGLPPALVVTGTFDPLRPDGQAYTARLNEAGVEATNLNYPMTHVLSTPAVRDQLRTDLSVHARRLLGVDG